MKRIKLRDRDYPNYTKGEEIANMVSHIIGAAVGVVALIMCVIMAIDKENIYGIIGGVIFGISMTLLYTMSSIYHGLKKSTAKKVFQVIDHCTIFVLIAGTYTPILLCSVRSFNTALSWIIFGIIWSLAIIGIVLNSIDLKRYKVFSMICYLGMGWCIIFTAKDLFPLLSQIGTWLLIGGGIFYTIGAVFYIFRKKYFHMIFHILVDIGSICHFLCILLYVI